MNKVKKIMESWWLPLACGLFVVLIFQFVFLIGYVPSGSMEPTISAGSYIIGLRNHGELRCGDIVMFRMDERILVKRIAAVPGDTIDGTGFILMVPDGCYYLLGDNSEESLDSRYWEDPFLWKEAILAKLLTRARHASEAGSSPKQLSNASHFAP